MPAPLQLDLLTCVEIDPYTFLLTARERRTERRWFRTITSEIEKSYTLDVRVGFMRGDQFIMRSATSFRLWELFMAWRAERKLDAYIESDGPRYLLPPVPVLPRRA